MGEGGGDNRNLLGQYKIMYKDLILRWREYHKDKKTRRRSQVEIKEIREKLFTLMGNDEIVVLEEYVLQKQYHEKYSTVAVWDKKTWNDAERRRLEWSQQNLDWLK